MTLVEYLPAAENARIAAASLAALRATRQLPVNHDCKCGRSVPIEQIRFARHLASGTVCAMHCVHCTEVIQ